MEQEITEATIQNLRDAGCSDEMIEQYIKYEMADCDCGMMRILAVQRCSLLDSIHVEQHKLDCLDYLIHKVKKR